MMSRIHAGRIQRLNTRPVKDRGVILYWMQASQRVEYNHALEYAVQAANKQKKPLVVFFGLTGRYPRANVRHYAFLLDGLKEIRSGLEKRGIQFVVQNISPEEGVISLSQEACQVVTDRGYTRIQQQWREQAARAMDCMMIQVESDIVVPVETASDKEEYSAATFRPKLHKRVEDFLQPLQLSAVNKDSLQLTYDSLSLEDPGQVLTGIGVERSTEILSEWKGGRRQARRRLANFIEKKLDDYPRLKNDPVEGNVSGMSPYLHFGQISPLEIALRVKRSGSRAAPVFLEELLVRRELGINFVRYQPHYDRYDSLPEWARKTLSEHKKDRREFIYSHEDFEKGRTHDPYWNAAQKEMVLTGKMHGYMRMYWGKKILEWSPSPEVGFETALVLNDTYELDGRDPNGYAGVAWCFGKHDRPWPERPVFGKVRYMNANGLKRKFDADQYVRKIKALEDRHPQGSR